MLGTPPVVLAPVVPVWPGLKVEAPPGWVCAVGFWELVVGGDSGVTPLPREPGDQLGVVSWVPTRPGTEPTGGTCEPTAGGCEPIPGVVAWPVVGTPGVRPEPCCTVPGWVAPGCTVPGIVPVVPGDDRPGEDGLVMPEVPDPELALDDDDPDEPEDCASASEALPATSRAASEMRVMSISPSFREAT